MKTSIFIIPLIFIFYYSLGSFSSLNFKKNKCFNSKTDTIPPIIDTTYMFNINSIKIVSKIPEFIKEQSGIFYSSYLDDTMYSSNPNDRQIKKRDRFEVFFSRLNKNLKTDVFSFVQVVVSTDVYQKGTVNYEFVAIEEWHFKDTNQSTEAFQKLESIPKTSFDPFIFPENWIWLKKDNKIYFFRSHWVGLNSKFMISLKERLKLKLQ